MAEIPVNAADGLEEQRPPLGNTESVSSDGLPASPRAFWNLGVDDKRVLYITIIGGVAANVALVLIVGLGILEAHLIHRYRHQLSTVIAPQVLAALASAVSSAITSRFRGRAIRERNSGASDSRRREIVFGRIALGFAVLIATVLILALVGLAAGVK